MESFSNWLTTIPNQTLYHGTARDFDEFSLDFAGERDYGDWGLGVYLSPSSGLARMYAYNKAKEIKQPPIVMRVRHQLQKSADLDSPILQAELTRLFGIPFPKVLKNGVQTRPKQEAMQITQYLMSQGFDSAKAQYGREIVAYDPNKLQIIEKVTEDRFDFLI